MLAILAAREIQLRAIPERFSAPGNALPDDSNLSDLYSHRALSIRTADAGQAPRYKTSPLLKANPYSDLTILVGGAMSFPKSACNPGIQKKEGATFKSRP